MKKSILFIMAGLMPSGVETMLRAIGPDWAAQGWMAHILSTGDDDCGPFTDQLRSAGYEVHHLPFRRRVGFLTGVWTFLRRHRFDIVHIQCERAGFWFTLLSVLAGARVFRSVHGIFCFSGALRWRRMLQRRLSRRLGVVFTGPSQGIIANELHRFSNPCRHLPNWIDDSRFSLPPPGMRDRERTELGISPDDFVLLSAGACGSSKNHEAVIEALSLLPETVMYLHAGSGPPEQEEMALAASMGVSDRVHFLGVVDPLSPFLAAADVFVMPSRVEGLGLAAVEALASGLPCILSRIDGMSDLMAISRAGAWCEPNGASLAAAVRQVMAIPRQTLLPQTLTDAAAAVQTYSSKRGFDALMDLYGGPH